MKKAEFYNGVKTNINYLTGLSREEWYKNGGSIALQTSEQLVVLSFNRNVVTLFTKWLGKKGETVVIDYSKGYKNNMVILTAEAIDRFLAI